MTILALDLGTTTGWALGNSGGVVATGVFDLKAKRHESVGMRFINFRNSLTQISRAYTVQRISYEEVRRHMGTDAAHVYGGLVAVLQSFALDHGIEYEAVPVQRIKSFATGKGNAPKEAVIKAVRGWGFKPADDNEADAIALLKLKLEELS